MTYTIINAPEIVKVKAAHTSIFIGNIRAVQYFLTLVFIGKPRCAVKIYLLLQRTVLSRISYRPDKFNADKQHQQHNIRRDKFFRY